MCSAGSCSSFKPPIRGSAGECEWNALNVIHRFCDVLVMDSSTQFVARQQADLQGVNDALAETTARLQKANAELVQRDARRLRMLRTVTHEVRNHLNAVSVVVMLLDEETAAEDRRLHLEMLSRNLNEITSLMKQLLDFAALLSDGERLELDHFDPADLHHELALFLQEISHRKGLSFRGSVDGALDKVFSDRSKLHRIAMNLAMNAVKYTGTGEVHLCFRAHQDEHWVIEVRDTGPGIPAAEQESIFQEFHRVAATSGSESGQGSAWRSPGNWSLCSAVASSWRVRREKARSSASSCRGSAPRAAEAYFFKARNWRNADSTSNSPEPAAQRALITS